MVVRHTSYILISACLLLVGTLAIAQPSPEGWPGADSPPQPVPRETLPDGTGEPFTEVELVLGDPTIVDDDMAFWWGTLHPPRVIVRHDVSSDAWPHPGTLYDLSTGEALAEFGVPNRTRTSLNGETVRVLRREHGEYGLLIPETGGIHFPVPLSPLGERLGDTILIVDPSRADALVFAEGSDGGHYFGTWADPNEEALFLDGVLPFTMSYIVHRDEGQTIDLWHGNSYELNFVETLSLDLEGCNAVRLESSGPPTCLADGSDSRGMRFLLMDEGYGVRWMRFDAPVLTNYRTEQQSVMVDGIEELWVNAALMTPPRVIATTPEQRVFVWSPEGTIYWDDEDSMTRGGQLGDIDTSILTHLSYDLDRTPSTRWLDVERGRVWDTPSLVSLRSSSQYRRALAMAPSETESDELYLLDFDGETIEHIASVECVGELVERNRLGGWTTIVCRIQPDPGLHRFETVWSEVIDLDGRRRWRTPYTIESIVGPGAIILSDRTQSAAESTSTCTNLYFVELD